MKNKASENYLDYIYIHHPDLTWTTQENEVVLHKENKGLFNRIAQVLLKKPKVSYIHMEEMGSFIWPLIDGNRSIYEIGILVKEHFGESAEPLYERLSVYFKNMESYDFILRK